MLKRAPTATVMTFVGVHRSTPGETVRTMPLIDVTEPPVPAGSDTMMSRTVPALVAVPE